MPKDLHERLSLLSLGAAGLWAKALCLTGALITKAMVHKLDGDIHLATELVTHGLWITDLHGFRQAGFSPKDGDVENREKTRERVRKWRQKNSQKPALQSVTCNALQSVTKALHPAVSQPLLLKNSSLNSQISSENSFPLSAAENSVAREGDSAAAPVELKPMQSRASKGRIRLRAVSPLVLDFDHGGRWQHALAELAEKPADEWSLAAPVLAREAQKPGMGRVLTPQHIVDHWHLYRVGDVPGGKRMPLAAAANEQPSAPYHRPI